MTLAKWMLYHQDNIVFDKVHWMGVRALKNPLDCWMRKIKNEFPPPKDLNPALSDRVDWAIRRAMSAEPSQRPARSSTERCGDHGQLHALHQLIGSGVQRYRHHAVEHQRD